MIKFKKKNLVIAAVGDKSMHSYWMPNTQSDYDLALIYYGDGDGYQEDTPLCRKAKGTKYQLLAQATKEHPEMFDYQYIWMPDDDIVLPREEIERLFDIMQDKKLWLAQPSIMGWYGLDVTLHHKDCFLRYTNYVEIMCPCFETNALKKCLFSFNLNKTGWGIDHLWNKILGHPTDKLAVIDDIVAVHTRPVGGGDMYKNQAKGSSMEGAIEDNVKVYNDHKLGESSYEDLKKGHLVSAESFGRSYHNTVEYGRIYKQLEAGVDVSERLWPPSPLVEKFCDDLRSSTANAAQPLSKHLL